MKKFWIDFAGSFLVEAENAKEAQNKFWQFTNNYNQTHDPQLSYCVIEGIEPADLSHAPSYVNTSGVGPS